jgi:hypothetical protein
VVKVGSRSCRSGVSRSRSRCIPQWQFHQHDALAGGRHPHHFHLVV